MRRTSITTSGALALLALNVLCLGGCNLSKPYPDKTLHTIELGDPPPVTGAASSAAVRVDRVRVAEPFNNTTFVYKVGDSTYTTDYYNGFIAEPGRLLTGDLSAW